MLQVWLAVHNLCSDELTMLEGFWYRIIWCKVNKIMLKFNLLTWYFNREYFQLHFLLIRGSYLPFRAAIYWYAWTVWTWSVYYVANDNKAAPHLKMAYCGLRSSYQGMFKIGFVCAFDFLHVCTLITTLSFHILISYPTTAVVVLWCLLQ